MATTEDREAAERDLFLGIRAMACNDFRWIPGMSNRGSEMVMDVSPSGWPRFAGDDDYTEPGKAGTLDVRVLLNVQALLLLVREAWKMPTGIVVFYEQDLAIWKVSWSGSTHGGDCGSGKTEAEALICALENAP